MSSGFLDCRYEWDPVAGEWRRTIDCEGPSICPTPPTFITPQGPASTITFDATGPISVELHPRNLIVVKAQDKELFRAFQAPTACEGEQAELLGDVTVVTVKCPAGT